MNKETLETLQNNAANYISELFENHQINCTTNENEIIFSKELINIETCFFDMDSNNDRCIVQLDVYIMYGINPILESFAGIGKDFETALINALETFKSNTFHSILAAFFTSDFDDEISKYNWKINDKNFEVFSSDIITKGIEPEKISSEWINSFKEEIQKLNLDEGTHWIRLFYAQQNNNTSACEVLINNDIYIPLQQKAENFNWNKHEEYYSIRVFIVLKSGIDFERMVKIVGSNEEYESLFSRLKKMGISDLDIEKAFAFIPETFGRKFIQDFGIEGNFSNIAFINNAVNEQIEINLENEEMFIKATELINRISKNGWSDNSKEIAFQSACFDVLNSALNEGVNSEDLNCSDFTAVFNIPNYNKSELD